LLGFLPVNDASGSGIGFVNYTIKPVAGVHTGDSITAKASVVFDINDPVATNTWLNIIDAVAPTSSITALPATTTNPLIALHYTGQDDAGGSGIQQVDFYVSDNGGTINQYVVGFTGTDTTYTGTIGHTYTFYAKATDNVGNVETLVQLGNTTITSVNQINTCPGGTITLYANSVGSSYQWQVDNGSGFTNITNSGVYNGTNTAILTITGAPGSLYGSMYRAVVNGATYTPGITVKFVIAWQGGVSNAWENTANWSCGVLPDANTDVTINGNKLNFPRVSSNQTIRSIRVNPGATVTVATGANLTILK
jgi:hypothetical protein